MSQLAEPASPPVGETVAAPLPTLAQRFAATGLRALVSHQSWVAAQERMEEVYEIFRKQEREFLAVLDGAAVVGVCSRRQVGMLLGARYGFALYARKPIRAHLMPSAVRIVENTPLSQVFAQAFSRSEDNYYDDVVLVDEHGTFLGLIPVQTLVRLQHELLEENIAQLERSRLEIQKKNQQIEDDLRMARELQMALLPSSYPAFPRDAAPGESALNFAHRFEPSGTVGGDFFHVEPLGEKQASIFICDVMGHDVRAALVTAMLRAMLEEVQARVTDPAELIAEINRELLQILRLAGGVMFATAAAAVIDAAAGEIRYALAGHPQPVLVRAARGECDFLHPLEMRMGPALGIFDHPAYATRVVPLEPGDRVLFFTDGLFEVMNAQNQEFGRVALRDAIAHRATCSLPGVLDGVLQEVRVFAGATALEDDVCLLGVELSRVG
jgi:serine phosphatase RsbU (regulator of sigma subunit)